ncbi:UNKNOWN [Stylonychia lemnae]|uniref:Trichohyalin-plectin-homology domain-containing protein n=1 Tax=Stylonychia lemnae TaxID=5949 RepID=A0A078A043_STYLE|nr:UNKNOWN [Stylonychia lemnae]|eukprot:CDW75556.1 UNKNOWN [Stylonychia lemnae]
MSYPKQHPSKTMPLGDVRTQVKSQKREQIKLMLINKFRLKYNAQKSTDSEEIDQYIREEVENLMSTTQLSEVDLKNLDRKLRQKYGSSADQRTFELQSSVSQKSIHANVQKQSQILKSSMSQRSELSLHSLKSKTVLEQTANNLQSVNGDAGEEAWADIVRFNTIQYQQEQEELKRKKEEQKLRVREELAKQMEERKLGKKIEKQSDQQYFEKQKHFLEEQEKTEKQKQFELQQKIKQEAQTRSEQLQATIQKRNDELKMERMQGNQMRQKMQDELEQEKRKLKERMENFKREQSEQLINNKLLRQEQLKKELEQDNRPPSGHDLMHSIYQDKVHVSYEKRAKQDKIHEHIKEQIENGESIRRINQEQKALEKYIKKKEVEDKLADHKKRQIIKMQEMEAKRMLDLQVAEREQNKKLRKFENTTDAKFIVEEIKVQGEIEKKKLEEIQIKNKTQFFRLKDQIEERKKPKKLDPIEYDMNKKLIEKIQTVKAGNGLSMSQSQVFAPSLRGSMSVFQL